MEIRWTDRVRNEEGLQRVEERNIIQRIKRKAKWFGHIWCKNCLLQHVTEDSGVHRIFSGGGFNKFS